MGSRNTNEPPLLQVIDLHLKREGRSILQGVNLTIDRQQVHAVLGLMVQARVPWPIL